jgi:hypothetical protein
MSVQYFVYNPFDRFSTLAAAVVKGRGNNLVYKSTDRLPTLNENDHVEYFNMKKYKLPKGVKTNEKGTHVWVNSQIWTSEEEDTAIAVDVFANACSAYQFNAGNGGNINHLVNDMYRNKLTLNELIVLWKNIDAAKSTLSSRSDLYIPFNFDLNESNRNKIDLFKPEERYEFIRYIQEVKQKAERNYSIQFVECNGKFYRTVVTFFSDEDYFWIRRLFNLGNKHYANVCVSSNGCVIDTNLDSVENFQVDLTCHKSDEFFQR